VTRDCNPLEEGVKKLVLIVLGPFRMALSKRTLLLFIFTRNGNDSDGAVDNASGVGVPALSLTSVSGEGWRLHTPRDRFSLLGERGLEEMGKFLLATVQWLETGRQE